MESAKNPIKLEARGGIEPPNKGFADLLPQWVKSFVCNTESTTNVPPVRDWSGWERKRRIL